MTENFDIHAKAEAQLVKIPESLDPLVISDTAERKRAETTQKESESRYRVLFEVSADALFLVDCDTGQILDANDMASALYGYNRDELLTKKNTDLSAEPDEMIHRTQDARTNPGGVFHIPLHLHRKKNGSVFSVEITAMSLVWEGHSAHFIACRDITERTRAEAYMQASLQEKVVLLKEIHHRMKNNLQIVSSLLNMQSARIEDPIAKAVLQDMQHRIRSIALVHESLYRSDNLAVVDLDAYLKSLCPRLFRSLVTTPGTIRLQMNLAPVKLDIDQAIPCGLLVNELMTNALKHAFPDSRGGELRVELQELANGHVCRLRVIDNGVGLPPDFDLNNLTSFGLRLVSDLARQLGGQVEVGAGPGTTFEIEVKAMGNQHPCHEHAKP